MNLPLSFYFFIGVFLVFIIVEALYGFYNDKNLYNSKDTLVNLFFGVSGVLNRAFSKGIWLSIWIFLYQFSFIKIPQNVWTYVLLFFANEFVYYWFHRLSHEIRILWAVHVNHHSSEYLNFTTSARIPFFNLILHNIFWIPLLIIGFDPIMIFEVENIGFLFAFVQHTKMIKNYSIFDYFLNSPSHHRVHHASNEPYLNKNYGNVLIIFDRIFGTFQEERTDIEIKFGLIKNIKTYNPIKLIFHEWVAIFKRN